jgi:hypothetical protein
VITCGLLRKIDSEDGGASPSHSTPHTFTTIFCILSLLLVR